MIWTLHIHIITRKARSKLRTCSTRVAARSFQPSQRSPGDTSHSCLATGEASDLQRPRTLLHGVLHPDGAGTDATDERR